MCTDHSNIDIDTNPKQARYIHTYVRMHQFAQFTKFSYCIRINTTEKAYVLCRFEEQACTYTAGEQNARVDIKLESWD